MTAPRPRFVGLYSGAGGLDLGFILGGCTPVWTNELDPHASATHRDVMRRAATQMGVPAIDVAPHACGDLDEVPMYDLPSKGDAELVIGGPPCQGFSQVGKQRRDDPRSRHVHRFLDMVDRVRPLAFVMENVPTLANGRRFADIRTMLLERSTQLGYDARIHLLNAAAFGVPQARRRMFFIGFRFDVPHASVDLTSPGTPPVTIREALKALPPYGTVGNDGLCRARVVPSRRPILRASPYAGILFNGRGRVMDLDRPALTLPASMGGNHTPIIDQESLETGAAPWILDYHRHLRDGGAPYRSVPDRLRRLTVQEAAVLQTFPVETTWHGSQSARLRQIGNAVPPLLAAAVARRVLAAIDDDRRPSA